MYTCIPSLFRFFPTHPLIIPFYIIRVHYQSSTRFSLNIKYLGWGNSSIVAQRISWVQSRRWWQGELARPDGPCCLKVGDKLGKKSLGANLAASPKCCYKGSISPPALSCRSAGAHPGECHELITRATMQQLRLLSSAQWELTSCCESVLNLQSGKGEVSWDDLSFDMALGVLFHVVWVGCVGGGMALFGWLECLRWGCESSYEASMW